MFSSFKRMKLFYLTALRMTDGHMVVTLRFEERTLCGERSPGVGRGPFHASYRREEPGRPAP